MCKKTKLKLSFGCPVVFPCWDYVTLTELAEYWSATNLIQNYSILLSRIQRKFYGMRDESKNWDGGWGWGEELRGGSRIFLGGGAPLRNDVSNGEVNKSKSEYVYTKKKVASQRVLGGGWRTPCTLSLDPPLELEIQEERVELLLYSGEIQIKFLSGTGLSSK